MKNSNSIKKTIKVLLGLVLLLNLGCERDLTDEATQATFPTIGDVFTDTFVAMGSNFYLPFADSKLDAFSVDNDEGFESDASIRIDVPNADDPTGNYAGAIFRVDGAPRDLSGYDALTFYAKASQGVSIDQIGFGIDFIGDKYQATANSLSVGTNWAKYIIPIPDPSKLTEELGVFWYAAGTQDTGGLGYTFWVDEIKFENLGTIAQPRPKILLGQDQFVETFIGSQLPLGGLTQTFNLPTGFDQTVTAAPAYFDFEISGPSNVIGINEQAVISVSGPSPIDNGTGEPIPSVVTASLAGVDAEGSFSVVSLGEFELAPIPDEDPANVISIFSDQYTNVPVDYYNGFFNGDGQTTQGGAPPLNVNGEEVINYTDLNFVGVGTFLNVAPVNASGMTHFHVDINVQEDIDPGDFINLILLNGVQTSNEISGSYSISGTELQTNGWSSFDIPLSAFTGLTNRDALGLIFFVSDATISNIYVDNIYYYNDPDAFVQLPVDFESTTLAYNFLGFEGANSAIEGNPDMSGLNSSATVMRTIKTNGSQFFAGTLLDLDLPIDFSTTQQISMKTWSPKAGIPVRMALELAGGGQQIFVDVNTTVTNQWEELVFDFSSVFVPGTNYGRVVVFFEFIVDLPGDGSTYYYDDIQLVN